MRREFEIRAAITREHPVRHVTFTLFLSILLVLAISIMPVVRRATAAPQERGGGTGNIHRDDPCTHLPNPPGNALGIQMLCPPGGSSSGVVKGDFNHDGFADLAIAEPGASINGQSGAGDVIIMYGSANGLTSTGHQLFFEGLIPGTTAEAGDGFGTALASGDFNGDGFSDLAIGIPFKKLVTSGSFGSTTHPQSGAIVVIYGSPNGLTTNNPSFPPPRVFNLSMAALPHLTFPCTWNLDKANLGFSLAWGDFNHDGRGDLVAAAPGLVHDATTCGFAPLVLGAVWEILGTGAGASGGLGLTGNHVWSAQEIPVAPDTLPLAVSLSAGDFNGDLNDDLAIGCLGAVVILNGGSSGLNPVNGPQLWTLSGLTGTANNDLFGWAVAAGDFNGDGKADLAIGVPTGTFGSGPANSGFVVALYGSQSLGLTSAGAQFWNSAKLGQTAVTNDSFGLVLAAGDFNGDGRADLAVGIPLKDFNGLTDAGEVDVIYGSSTGLSIASRAPTILHDVIAPESGQQFGGALTAWNFGRDEVFGSPPFQSVLKSADLAVGVPLQNVAGVSGAGAVNVFYGSVLANGITTANAQNLTAFSVFLEPLAGAHFGGALY